MSQRESSQRGQGPCGDWKALHPWRSSSKKHGHHPLPIPSFQKAAGSTFLERQLFSWGVPGWRGETAAASRVSCFERGTICTPFIQSFLSAPQPAEATAPEPLRLRAPALPGPAAEPPRSPAPADRHPEGRTSPQVRAGEKQPSSPPLFCFPFAVTQPPRRGRPGTPAPHSPGSLCRAVDRRRLRPRAA